jgi:hypothetical protein
LVKKQSIQIFNLDKYEVLMAKVQKHFELFHNRIRVSTEPLIEKRDIILDMIREYLKKNDLPSFELINQGSYIYGVGIKPLGSNEYDIDVGLAFNIKTADYPDARTVRGWVLDAIKGHTKKVKDRGPCIRVHYAQGFHVDLVIYAKHTISTEVETLQLGKKDGTWVPADPKNLKEFIKNSVAKFKSTKIEGEATQIQRVVRYIKRWNDLRIEDESQDKPTGIALLLLAIENLSPILDNDTKESDDLSALIGLCDKVISLQFAQRISVKKPTPEFEDVFGKISDEGMKALKAAFGELGSALKSVAQAEDTVAAAKILQGVFGDDFPVMEEIQKSELAESLQLDETDRTRLAKVAALRSMASSLQQPAKPWFYDE